MLSPGRMKIDSLSVYSKDYSFWIMGSSVNHLRTPLYREMVSIISGSDVTFEGYKLDFDEL